MSVTQTMERYQSILEDEVPMIARETGAVKRVRKDGIDAATLVQSTIFGWWQDPDLTLGGLTQVAERRDVSVTASAISQRFTPECVALFEEVLKRMAQVHLESEPVDVALLKAFSAVIVEDSSSVLLPDELASVWQGCGGKEAMSGAAVKLFVRWNVLSGEVMGPRLCDGRTNDHESPFETEELPAHSLYLADLGFFGVDHLCQIARHRQAKRYFVTRVQPGTHLYTRQGHRHTLRGLLPQQVGQVRDLGVILGKTQKLAVRLILVKVPEDVAKERKARIRRAAQKHGRVPSEEVLYMANWTVVITNVPRVRAYYAQVLVLLRLRWQIERLFRLWKEDGRIDEWRSKKPDRILCEFYAKLCAMVMQQVLIQEGCWLNPHRSIVKAAACLRREANRIMLAFSQGNLHQTLVSILRSMQSGCALDKRAAHPSTAQLLLDGLDWQLEFLLT